MNFAKATAGGILVGLGVGIWIGAALIAGSDMDGMSVIPSLLMAMTGGALINHAHRNGPHA